MLRFGYNTNGLGHHRLDDALTLLAELGYDGCALTLDVQHLDPYAPGVAAEVERVGRRARSLGLGLVIETGARYLLDPRHKHHPTLLSDAADERQRRRDFLVRACHIARDLGAEALSLWSGVPRAGGDRAALWSRLVDELVPLVALAKDLGVPIGFEPEPGMLVESMADFERLRAALDLSLTLDLGHAHLTESASVPEVVRQFAALIVNVHAEDMRRPVHEHLPFGSGEMNYPHILRALDKVGYRGLINVELSRDSHRGAAMAREAITFLRKAHDSQP
jgi:sugar phosphate isomerase/epimerase